MRSHPHRYTSNHPTTVTHSFSSTSIPHCQNYWAFPRATSHWRNHQYYYYSNRSLTCLTWRKWDQLHANLLTWRAYVMNVPLFLSSLLLFLFMSSFISLCHLELSMIHTNILFFYPCMTGRSRLDPGLIPLLSKVLTVLNPLPFHINRTV